MLDRATCTGGRDEATGWTGRSGPGGEAPCAGSSGAVGALLAPAKGALAARVEDRRQRRPGGRRHPGRLDPRDRRDRLLPGTRPLWHLARLHRAEQGALSPPERVAVPPVLRDRRDGARALPGTERGDAGADL